MRNLEDEAEAAMQIRFANAFKGFTTAQKLDLINRKFAFKEGYILGAKVTAAKNVVAAQNHSINMRGGFAEEP